jgi:Domain of unknown function (DUF4412)
VRWTFNIEITDPAMKKQMAAAEKRMSDPKMQAEMQQAQAAMSDPQMQAMMAQNPQMKAMMEQQMSAMKSMQSGGSNPMMNMFPKAVILQTKSGKTLSAVEGGAMPTEVLNLPAESASFLIDRKAHTFKKLPGEKPDAATSDASTYTVTKTAETSEVLGYTCTKYVVDAASARGPGEGKGRYLVWATTAVSGLDSGALSKLRFSQHGGDNGFMRQIEGVPLKMEITTPQARVIMQAASIQAESLADEVFTVPAGYTERTN